MFLVVVRPGVTEEAVSIAVQRAVHVEVEVRKSDLKKVGAQTLARTFVNTNVEDEQNRLQVWKEGSQAETTKKKAAMKAAKEEGQAAKQQRKLAGSKAAKEKVDLNILAKRDAAIVFNQDGGGLASRPQPGDEVNCQTQIQMFR